MDEKNNPDPAAPNFWDWLAGFVTDQGLPGKLRGMAKAILIFGAFWVFYLLGGLGLAGVLFIVPGIFLTFAIAWALYAVADIHEKTAENNDILRKAVPEHATQSDDPSEP